MANEKNNGKLVIKPSHIELIYDSFDSNAANFILPSGYFCIQTSVHLEDDARLNEPFIEFNSQAQAQCGGIRAVIFSNDGLNVEFFESSRFLGRHVAASILLRDGVSRELVDFFVNRLFLGHLVSYSPDFDEQKVCVQTSTRAPL